MNIIKHASPAMTLGEFADQHGLDIHVHERDLVPPDSPSRWYAQFPDSWTKDGGCLRGEYGNGQTPEDAIREYARLISCKLLVLNPGTLERREILVPFLKEAANGGES